MNAISWLEEWYKSNCDSFWEHDYGMSIETLDNPGWRVMIELHETQLEEKKFNNYAIDNGEDDWIECRVGEGIFHGSGDPSKLLRIIEIFKSFAEDEEQSVEADIEETDSLQLMRKYGKVFPWVETWNDFLEKYVAKKESFLLIYEDVNIRLTHHMDKTGYLIEATKKNTKNIVEYTEDLLRNTVFNTKNVREVWGEAEIYMVENGKEKPIEGIGMISLFMS